MRSLLQTLTGLPKPDGTTWSSWAQERVALICWPTMALLFVVGVVFRIHVRAALSGWFGRD